MSSARPSACSRGTLCALRGASVTLSSTVMCGNRLNAWNTMPIRARTASASALGSQMSRPSSSITPSSTVASRSTQRSSVDLPEPEAPMRTTHSGGATSRSRPSSTTLPPNTFRTPPARSRSSLIACSHLLAGRQVPAAPHDVVGEPGQRDREEDEEQPGEDVRSVVEILGLHELCLPERVQRAEDGQPARVLLQAHDVVEQWWHDP